MSPALQGRPSTTGLPAKPPIPFLKRFLQTNRLKKANPALGPQATLRGPVSIPEQQCPGEGGTPHWSPSSPADTARGPEEGHRHIHSLTVLDALHPKGLFWFSSSQGSNKLITDDKRLICNCPADKIVQTPVGRH